jgi:hypothetical protein
VEEFADFCAQMVRRYAGSSAGRSTEPVLAGARG